MRATGAPHPVKIDSIKFTLDIKGKEDYILKNMASKAEAILPRELYIGGEIPLNVALTEVLGDKDAAGYYDRALSKLIKGVTGECQMCFTKSGNGIDKVDIIIRSGLKEETHIEIDRNSFLIRGQNGERRCFRSKLVMPPPATLDTQKLLPFHSQGGSTVYLGIKREHGRGIYDEEIEVHRIVVVGGSFP